MMTAALILIPISILLGLLWVGVFFWSLNSDQYSDLEGASQRILYDDDAPLDIKPIDAARLDATQKPPSKH